MSRGMEQFRFNLTAGEEQQLEVLGDWFHVLIAPLQAGVRVRFDDGKQGVYFEGVGIRRKYEKISILSTADQVVVLMLGFGEVADSRATANLNINATFEPANLLDNLAEVTVPAGDSMKLADAAVGSRKELRVALSSTQPGGVYLGDASIANNSGGFLEPGQFDYISLETELWAYNPGASDTVVNLLDLKRV